MASTNSERAHRVIPIARSIHPLLAGIGADMQGAVLADLVATWIAGHRATHPAGERDAAAFREAIFDHWIDAVRDLVELELQRQNGPRD